MTEKITGKFGLGRSFELSRIIIIGGGIGGLTLATKLARSIPNAIVTLYEKNDKVGGRCSAYYHKDQNADIKYKFEQGAILYLFHDIYKAVFGALGAKLEKEVNLIDKVDHHKIFLGDGEVFNYSTETETLAKEIEKLAPGSNAKEKLEEFIESAKAIENFVIDDVFLTTYDTFMEMFFFLWFNVRNNFNILWNALRYSMFSKIAKFFPNEKVCQVLTFQSLYFGISPFTSSSLFSMLTTYELTTGLKYPEGGMGAIAEALERIAEKNGVKIIKNKSVSKIEVKDGQATGVILDDGHFKKADIVISNADLTYTYNVLLKDQPERAKRAKELTKKDHKPSTITFYWGMKSKIEGLGPHNIFLPSDYKKLFDEIHVHKKIPDEPSFFIHIANRMDPKMSPDGKDALTVMVPVGEMSTKETRYKFEEKVAKVKDYVIKKLEQRLKINDFASLIEQEFETTTPDSWRDQFNCWEGNIVGTSHSLDNLLYFRSRQKCKEISNLYFVGASTQPGAGVPLVMCSALNLAARIEVDRTKNPY